MANPAGSDDISNISAPISWEGRTALAAVIGGIVVLLQRKSAVQNWRFCEVLLSQRRSDYQKVCTFMATTLFTWGFRGVCSIGWVWPSGSQL